MAGLIVASAPAMARTSFEVLLDSGIAGTSY